MTSEKNESPVLTEKVEALGEKVDALDEKCETVDMILGRMQKEISEFRNEMTGFRIGMTEFAKEMRQGFKRSDERFEKMFSELAATRKDFGDRVNISLDYAKRTDEGYFRNDAKIADMEIRIQRLETTAGVGERISNYNTPALMEARRRVYELQKAYPSS